MRKYNGFGRASALVASIVLANFCSSSLADSARSNPASQAPIHAPVDSYQRLLPLEGGSNFRDMGGYKTQDGKTIKKGLLFRSGVMSGLTEKDEAYLNQFNFSDVVDLRSDEELELYPNHWVSHNQEINYRHHNYSMAKMMAANTAKDKKPSYNPEVFYRAMPEQFEPQMKLYYKALLNNDGAVVVNCSAGQDRTGFASAVLLSALGVPKQQVIEDYLLSTQFRKPEIEAGDVDLKKAAETNAFAKMMLKYTDNGKPKKPKPLLTKDNTPYIEFALAQIEADYGSAEGYLKQVVGLSSDDIKTLRQIYLK